MNTPARFLRWPAVLGFATLLTVLMLLSAPTARAADSNPPGKMTFQGFLTDASTPPVPLGNTSPMNQDVTFTIYDNATGGAVKWAENQIVTVDKGHFSVLLGEGSSVGGQPHASDLSGVFIGADASDRWLGITVDGAEITPRIQFFAAPYAHLAKAANSLVNPSGQTILNLANGKLEGTSELTLNPGPLTVTGNASVSGNVGIGTTTPTEKLSVNGGISFANQNGGKKLYSPTDGTLEWLTHSFAAGHGFSIADQDGQKVYLNSSGNSFLNGGNVGIGTAAPRAKLEVDGNVILKGAAGGNSWSNQRLLWGGDGTGYPLTFASINNAGGINTPVLTMLDNGNVGIGTANPSARLHVNGNMKIEGKNILEFGSGLAKEIHNGKIGYQVFTGGLDIVGAGADVNSRKVTIHAQGGTQVHGRVGIGTGDPQAPLHVVGAVWHHWAYGFLNRNGAGATAGGVDTPLSIIADNRIGAAEFNAFSDARAKRVVGPSDNHLDLAIIQKLRVTDYQMIDTVTQGDAVKKGFIAQEVETVIPEAVSSTPRFVPDIYSLPSSFQFDEQKQTLAVILPKAHGLKEGDRVRILVDESQLELSVADIPSATEFVAEKVEKVPEQIFVYGKEVPDFRTVNYDRIFTTGIGAIQELARQVESLKAIETRIAELEEKTARMAELEAKAGRVDSLEREVAELKRLVAGLAQRQAPTGNAALLAGE